MPDPSRGDASAAQPDTAREILLVAAEQLSRTTAKSGRYWHTDTETGERADVGRDYDVLRRLRVRTWQPTRPGIAGAMTGRSLGATPLDEAAWRADGSPVQWTQKAPQGMPDVVIKAAPAPQWEPARPIPADRGYPLAGGTVSAAELAALPADPVKLRAWLLDRIHRTGGTESEQEALFWNGEALLIELPVTPQVRAATYRMLAAIDGVRSLGKVKDQSGRTGTAVAYDRQGDFGRAQTRLIIDLPTGRALAEESWSVDTGTLLSYQLIHTADFTDDRP
ncbi:hypothetical protein Ade02nite_41390 [Paractinoplanes deccanensis]|uniref:Uncharacterized protein n=1 Tax=Paractinoplanes deccanensis TaxID=113561 RepID=A0ABQ3Y689_9ACTN|nr:hypothetical protein Ade02nite_41390 [Actinoplanes deccanensis]